MNRSRNQGAIGWGMVLAVCALLALPLARIFQYPHRISTLPSLQVDAVTYDTIGVNLANERRLDAIPPLQPPGFVTFLAVLFTIFGHSWIAAKIALWVMLVCVTVMAGWLARRVYGSGLAGWIAALLCAGSPALGWYAQTIQYELLAALFVSILITVAAVASSGVSRPVTTRQALVIALIGGAAVLAREVLLVIVPIVAVALAWRIRASAGAQAAWQVGALIVIIPIIMATSWSIVQSARTGRSVALSDKGPAVLMFGNNPLANGTFNAGVVGIGRPSGFAFIREEPRWAAWLAARKALYFWGILRDGWNVPRPAALWASRASGGWLPLERTLPWARGGWLLVALTLALLLWTRAMWCAWWPIPAAIAIVMAVHVVTVSSHRFAVPILPLVFLVAAGPLAQLVAAVWRRPRFCWTAATLAIVFCALQLPSWGIVYNLRAAEMDATRTDDVHDQPAGGSVRFADTVRGARLVFALTDEELPAGVFDIRIAARTDAQMANDSRTALRVTITALDGAPACRHDVTAAAFDAVYQTLSLPCSLNQSGPVSLFVETLAVIPLRFGNVTLAWR